MSNKRKLRLQPHRVIDVDIEDVDTAYAWERCEFHDDCCDPDDMTCTRACGTPATAVLLLSHPTGPRRVPFCRDHLAAMGILAEHMLRTKTAEAN